MRKWKGGGRRKREDKRRWEENGREGGRGRNRKGRGE